MTDAAGNNKVDQAIADATRAVDKVVTPKCQVRWIDSKGQLTPDTNNAVMMAHFHEPIWQLPAGGPGNHIVGYSDVIRESFPICAVHYARVDASFRPPRGGWTFTPIETNVSPTETDVSHKHESLIDCDGWESDSERARRSR